MNEPISLNYHEAQAVAERAARVRKIARQHRGSSFTDRTRVIVFIGNPYYSEKNPELHGLYLKVEGSGAPVPLFAKDLDYERNFEAARLPARDKYGHVQHPDMDGIGWDEFDMGPQLRALGWVSKTVSFEDDADDAAQDRYSDGYSPDCSYWTPTPPEGAGWLLAAIYDTEDGPVALFVRNADGMVPAPEQLWAVHVAGPDDVHAAPDRAQAIAAAARFNDWFQKRQDPHPLDPQMHAKVIEWPYSAEAHANYLPRWAEFAGKDGVPPAPIIGPSGSDWECVGGFRHDRHAGWQQLSPEYENDPDVTKLYRKRSDGEEVPRG